MFSPKQILINCITLLCLENRKSIATSPSHDLINNIVNTLPIPEVSIDHDHGRQTFLELRNITLWLNTRNEEKFPTETEILQQIQVACREESFLYEALLNVLMEKHDDNKKQMKIIQSYRGNLNSYLNDEKIVAILKDYHHRCVFKRQSILDLTDEVTEMGRLLEPLISERERSKHPALVGGMDFSDVETMGHYFADMKVSLSPEGALQTGWKGLNRALGSVGAFRRGEFVTVGGLQHNFKSGFMLSLFVHAALFNKPKLRDPKRKPLLYFMTFENEVGDNLLWIYRYLKENDDGEAVIDSKINIAEASIYVSERLRSNGFEIKMERYDPTEFTSASLVASIDRLYDEGFEVCGLYLDYLNMISKSGIEVKVAGDDIRLLFRRIRNYTSSLIM